MSDAAPLDLPDCDTGALILATLGEDTLPERALWALTGIPRAVLADELKALAVAGRIEAVLAAGVAAWRRAAPRPPPRRVVIQDPAPVRRDDLSGDGELSDGDRALIHAVAALGGLPRAERLPDGRTVWLGPTGRLWRQGEPLQGFYA